MVTYRSSCTVLFALPLLFSWPAQGNPSTPVKEQSSKQELSQSSVADAQPHYRRGVELFKHAVYDAALIEFRRAYEIAPSYKILYNIGQVSRQLDDFASALDAYRRYLSEGGKNVPSAREAEVKAEMERISQWVGSLEVTSKSADAEITVDDVVVGQTPIPAVSVNAGRRKVTATVPGRPPRTRLVDVAGGETARLSFDFTDQTVPSPNPAPVVPAPVVPAPQSSPVETTRARAAEPLAQMAPIAPAPIAPASPAPTSTRAERRTPWLLWGGVGVLAAGAVVTGVFALKSSNEIDAMKRDPTVTSSDYDETHSRMFHFSLATDVLTGLAIVTGGVALYLTLKPPGSDRNVGLALSASRVSLVHTF